jgi:hypothetical protein
MGFAMVLNDAQLLTLVEEPKKVKDCYPTSFPFRAKGTHYECEFEIETQTGNKFEIKVRQSSRNPLDFSVILVFYRHLTGQGIRLVRYNGKSHEHSNPIEKDRFYDFHIHKATERYMRRPGSDPETFAAVTVRYSDLNGAFRCLVEDCKIDFAQENLL